MSDVWSDERNTVATVTHLPLRSQAAHEPPAAVPVLNVEVDLDLVLDPARWANTVEQLERMAQRFVDQVDQDSDDLAAAFELAEGLAGAVLAYADIWRRVTVGSERLLQAVRGLPKDPEPAPTTGDVLVTVRRLRAAANLPTDDSERAAAVEQKASVLTRIGLTPP